MSTYAPFAKPLYVMLKPVGAVCNLACDYCYYLEKSKLYVNNPKHVMSDELLEKFIEEYINSQTMPQVLFTWHGGETLMRPLAFYKKAMELQKKYANNREKYAQEVQKLYDEEGVSPLSGGAHTTAPLRRSVTRYPSDLSSWYALLTVITLTPASSARARVVGSRSPGVRCP